MDEWLTEEHHSPHEYLIGLDDIYPCVYFLIELSTEQLNVFTSDGMDQYVTLSGEITRKFGKDYYGE